MSDKKDKKNKDKNKDAKNKKQTPIDNQQVEQRQHRWGLVVLLSLIAIVVSLYWIPAELHYSVTETYAFTAKSATEVNLAVLLPTTGQIQEVLDPEITWPGTWEIDLEGRLNVVRLTAEINADEMIEAVIKYDVNLRQGEAKWVDDLLLPNDLESTESIQAKDPEIIAQANQLRVENNNQLTAKNMFDFTIHHLVGGEETPRNADPDALSALQTGVGGAREHANLMTALCRSADIPSHTVSGLALPEIFPFFPISAAWNHPADSHTWVEVFVDDAWILADPSRSGEFYQRDLFGWTDGKHLVYDETTNLNTVYESLISEAGNDGTWNVSMSAPIRFVAWSEGEIEEMELSPMITLRKIWDGRLMMIASVIIILMVLDWLYEGDKLQSTRTQVGKNDKKGK